MEKGSGSTALVHLPMELEVPRDWSPGAATKRKAWEGRWAILDLIRRSPDAVSFISDLRRRLPHGSKTDFQVVFSDEALRKMASGDWKLFEAKDGSGLLPTLMDSSGKFKKQVRLKEVQIPKKSADSLLNASAHARTHAMLAQIIEKLEVIEKKVDLVLANQKTGWQGKIAFGIKDLRTLGLEAVERDVLIALASNAIQSLSEGIEQGARQVANVVDSMEKPGFLASLKGVASHSSVQFASQLDALERDLLVLIAGAHARAELRALLGQVEAASVELRSALEDLKDIPENAKVYYDYADFKIDREAFWRREFPAQLQPPSHQLTGTVYDFSIDEFEVLELEEAVQDNEEEA